VLVGLAAVCSLWPGLTLADQDDGNGDGNGQGNGRGRPGGFPFPFSQQPGNGGLTMRLVQVSQSNGGTGGDFPASSPGSDALSSGQIAWSGGNNGALVTLRGAVANSGYDVAFERLNDHGREDMGTITTDGNGNFSGATPTGLGGNGSRVGTFVLNRGGMDQYVAVL
jgi:hypothetical protein